MPEVSVTLHQFGWDAVSAISSVCIALLGVAVTLRLRHRDKAAERYVLLTEYRKEIIAYSSDFFEAIANALALSAEANLTQEARIELNKISMRLSALVDTGRFIYPNDISERNAYGHEKGPAFAGRRRPPLDAILAAHFAVEAMRIEGKRGRDECIKLSLRELKKTGFPLSRSVNECDPEYLLIQSRRCYLNAVVPGTFPQDWLDMFASLLGPLTGKK